MIESKLKACPFCGGDAESDTTQGFRRMMDGVISKAVAIYCLKCSAQISMCHDDHKEYAPEDMLTILTDAWNIRAGGQQPESVPTAEAIAGSLQQAGCASPYDKLKLSYLERQMEMCDKMLTASGVPEWVMNLDANGVPANSLPSRLKWYLARRKDVAAGEIDQELQIMMEENLRLAQARHKAELNDRRNQPES